MPETEQAVDAFIAVGSNINPERNIAAALDLLTERVRVTGVSTFYRTAPLGRPEQPNFLNGVFRIRTALEPRTLKFEVLRDVERRLGRLRTADRFAAREIDLDLLLYGDRTIEERGFSVPAEDIERPFVAIPLAELAPDYVLPRTGSPLSCLCARMDRRGLTAESAFTRTLRKKVTP